MELDAVKRQTVQRAISIASLVAFAAGLLVTTGCGPSGPGLSNTPPPPGGPKASRRKPPGEVDNPNTR